MKTVRMVEVGKPLQAQELPIPEYGDGDVLVRICAAGICHSDVHYRAGKSPVHPLPMTLGHEIAGVVEATGKGVNNRKVGDRVCLHYLIFCGNCYYCSAGNEQFCVQGKMLGHYRDGGYAEYISVPERNAILLPDEISFEHGATLMCASATSLHALYKSRLRAGERVAIFGIGGLGISALQLARFFGALEVFAVDINPKKLKMAEKAGAIPINAATSNPATEIRRLTGGQGVDVAIEMIGLPETMKEALRSLNIFGRAVIVGISDRTLEIDIYRELLGPETELIGSNDHLLQELPLLIELTRRGVLDLSGVVTRTIPLDAQAINQALDDLETYSDDIRTVIVP